MRINVASKYRNARRRVGNHRSRVSSLRGFTLIELMIVIAVLGIVMVIAVASYGSATMKTRRGAAQGCLMEAAQFMERSYTTSMTYATAKFPTLACATEQADYYTFSFSGTPDADSYMVQAVPQGSQATADTACGTMTLEQSGVKTEGGTASAVGECW